ncbi:MAG: DUF1501 domain-containing protein [Gemmataceae bacterium]|nr:DUF1501 domain-containing protein [Gemmataceae bacterium]MDW8267409.1 DUF1501 domain-containing protein [Gemmataceae bacterium]
MAFSRRDFLKSTSLVACGLTVPTFLSRTAAAAPPADQPGAKDTILVVVQLTGGNDGLNTVVPYTDPDYAKLRPTLKLPTAQLKKIDDRFGLHPSMGGLASLLEDRALCIVQGVGYPNPNQSHFRSMDIWQAASLADNLTEGWIGKALRSMKGTPAFHLATNNEFAPLALTGAPVRVPSITSLEDFQLKTSAASGPDQKNQRAVIEGVAQPTGGSPGLLDFVRRTAVNTYDSSRRLREIGRNYQPKVPYPQTGLANRLKLAAQLITAELGARIFYVSIDGFDTHANQLPTHAALLQQLSDAMTAFYKDLAARGYKDRLLMMTFSEFGRRPYENGSRGTDHGAAAPMLLVGSCLKAGIVGEQPSLTEDTRLGNLKYKIDFRQVYAAVLDRWLGVSSKEVLGEEFRPVEIFKA